jgi:lipoprotein-releasing system ATP-binding protein
MKPRLLLCDEPTGNLDQTSAEVVANLLLETHRDADTILIVVTHSKELAARFPQRFELRNQHLETV